MELTVSDEIAELVHGQLRSGRFATPEDVIRAGLAALEQDESFDDFAPGELNQMLAATEESLNRRGGIPADEIFAKVRQRLADR